LTLELVSRTIPQDHKLTVSSGERQSPGYDLDG